jgi:hypothetical protein
MYEESKYPLHILLICETNLTDNDTALYDIPGFLGMVPKNDTSKNLRKGKEVWPYLQEMS